MDPFAFYALLVDDNPLVRMDAQTILPMQAFRSLGLPGAMKPSRSLLCGVMLSLCCSRTCKCLPARWRN